MQDTRAKGKEFGPPTSDTRLTTAH